MMRVPSGECTLFPDGEWTPCCARHDIDYSPLGTRTRAEADRALYECVRDGGRPVLALVMYAGVRVFGWVFWRRKIPLTPSAERSSDGAPAN